MAIESIGNQNNWAQFIKAAEAARQRNQGLAPGTAHTGRKQVGIDRVDNPVRGRFSPQNAALAQRLYAPRTQPQPQKAMVGARFDAYA